MTSTLNLTLNLTLARARSALVALGLAGLAVGLASAAAAAPPEASAPRWDRIASIKASAVELGELQRARGAEGTLRFISACYKTLGLANGYTEAFESCIVKDYIQSRALALVYDRMGTEQNQPPGAVTAADVMRAFQGRASSAFAKYNIPTSDGVVLLDLVETHGVPAFLAILFPVDAEAGRRTMLPPRR